MCVSLTIHFVLKSHEKVPKKWMHGFSNKSLKLDLSLIIFFQGEWEKESLVKRVKTQMLYVFVVKREAQREKHKKERNNKRRESENEGNARRSGRGMEGDESACY